jgi:hypothetical protein
MKIMPPEQTPAKLPAKPAAKQPQPEAGPTFGQILDQAVDQPPSQVHQPANTMAIQRPQLFPGDQESALREASLQLETSLEALERYREALLDPQATLRDMAPLMASLEAAHQNLDEKLSHLPKDDPLRQIGDQTRSLIVAEKARFDSGIYQ